MGEQKDIQEVKNDYEAYEQIDRINPLILSSIFHYEFVFIHPFSDENGRTARL